MQAKRILPPAVWNVAGGLAFIGGMAAIWWLVTNMPIFGLLGAWLAFFMLVLYYTGHLKER